VAANDVILLTADRTVQNQAGQVNNGFAPGPDARAWPGVSHPVAFSQAPRRGSKRRRGVADDHLRSDMPGRVMRLAGSSRPWPSLPPGVADLVAGDEQHGASRPRGTGYPADAADTRCGGLPQPGCPIRGRLHPPPRRSETRRVPGATRERSGCDLSAALLKRSVLRRPRSDGTSPGQLGSVHHHGR
jgi:hypothetical protein